MANGMAELKALASKFQEHINNHDLDAAFALVDDQLIDHAAPLGTPPGKQWLRGQYGMFLSAYSDFRMNLEAISAEGDWVVLHAILEGTNTGSFLGMPPSGNPFKTYALEAFRVSDGKFVEHHQWYDIMAMIRAVQTPGGSEPIMGSRAGEMANVTTPEQKRARIQQYFNEMVIPRNIDRMAHFLGDNVLDHSAAPGMPAGVEGARMFLNMNYASFPWTNYDIQHVIVDGDLVTVIFEIEGEHTGAPFFGVPASGKRFKVQCIEIQRIPNEHFIEHWGGMDFVQLSNQLGLGLFGENAAAQGGADENAVRALAEQYIDGMNEGNIDRVMDVFAESFVDHQVVPGGAALGNTKADVRRAHEMLHTAFPDVKFSLQDLLIDGDQVVMRVRGEGTHTGMFFGMPPTGKYIKWSGVRLLRYADGKFAEGTSELDQVGILQQMGIIPTPPVVYDTEGNKAVIRKLVQELNKGNPNAFAQFMSPDVLVYFESAETPLKGVKWLNRDDGMLRAAFHDLHIEIESMAATRDTVATRLKFKGTHAGMYMGVQGTGKVYHWSGLVTDRLEDGVIVERWTNIDRFTLLQQVGIIPGFG
jgi:steroid delta-isomerase-like uncharacterized protein